MRSCATLIGCVISLALTACGGPSAPAPALTGTPTITPAVSAGSKPESTTALTAIPSPGPKGLEGGLLATFQVDEERFRVWVTNPYSVQIILRVDGGTSTSFVPNGRIRSGPGQGSHNAPWSWHLDAEDIGMDHFALEECSAAPSQVERNLDHFLHVVKRYCPWGTDLVRVEYFPRRK